MQQLFGNIFKRPDGSAGNFLTRFPSAMDMVTRRCDSVMKSNAVQSLLLSNSTFDLVIVGWFINDFHLGLSGHFRCPSVILSTLPPMKTLRDLTGNPSQISSVSIMGGGGQPGKAASFLERILRFSTHALEYVIMEIIELFITRPYYYQHFPADKNYPTWDEVKKNVSLILVNTHFSQGGSRALVPNLVEVGGIQMNAKGSPLPEVIINIF